MSKSTLNSLRIDHQIANLPLLNTFYSVHQFTELYKNLDVIGAPEAGLAVSGQALAADDPIAHVARVRQETEKKLRNQEIARLILNSLLPSVHGFVVDVQLCAVLRHHVADVQLGRVAGQDVAVPRRAHGHVLVAEEAGGQFAISFLG